MTFSLTVDTELKKIFPFFAKNHQELCSLLLKQKRILRSPEMNKGFLLARVTGLEPAIYGVTGRRDNQLRYTLKKHSWKLHDRKAFVNMLRCCQ